MNKRIKPEEEFSENLDRMLAGGKPEGGAAGDDYRTALDFAQKIIELRVVPRPTFKIKLKEGLLSQLSRSEQERKKSSFWKGLWEMILNNMNKPVWRAVTPIVLVAILVGGVLWGTGVLPGLIGGEVTTPPPPTPAPGPQRPPLEVGAIIGKNAYLPGEEIKIELLFKNVSSSTVQIQPFPPSVNLTRPNLGGIVRSFPAGTGGKSLNPGEATTYALTWDQHDNRNQQVNYGYYLIELGDIQVGQWRMKPNFGMLAPILILPVEGVMEKTVEVNKSVTVSGVSITLERVELSSSGMKVYAFNIPPAYNLPQGPQLPPPQMMISAFAEYSVDGGIVKQAGPSAIRFLDKGMEQIWENLDPVPKSAKGLTFRINKLGDWEGPWEFRVSLQ